MCVLTLFTVVGFLLPVFMASTVLIIILFTTSTAQFGSGTAATTFDTKTWYPLSGTQKEYMYYAECMNWNNAQSYCTSLGGQLASLTLPVDREFIRKIITQMPSGSCTSWPNSGKGIWLGGLHNGTWQSDETTTSVLWFDGTVTPFTDIAWDSNEPNNYQGGNHEGIGIHYPHMTYHTTYLGDSGCAFVCQRIVATAPNPTIGPTDVPTKYPTIHPTDRPSTNPTNTPTRVPTHVPTANPSKDPTTKPTDVLPTTKPTDVPTTNPTYTPTRVQTHVPTANPSKDPTTKPTDVPTTNTPPRVPTHVPTANPSKDPTTKPTDVPTTNTPPRVPTHVPTANPSKVPTTKPTDVPTTNPTYTPTRVQTHVPSANPSRVPTTKPTDVPTTRPTGSPTTKPTKYPTAHGMTPNPSKRPTSTPTFIPSSNPNVATPRTSGPTTHPIKQIESTIQTQLSNSDSQDNSGPVNARVALENRIKTIVIISLATIICIAFALICIRQKKKRDMKRQNSTKRRERVMTLDKNELDHTMQNGTHWSANPILSLPQVGAPNHQQSGYDTTAHIRNPLSMNSITVPDGHGHVPGTSFRALNMSHPVGQHHPNARSMDSDAKTHRSNAMSMMSMNSNAMTYRSNAKTHATQNSYAMSIDGGVMTGARAPHKTHQSMHSNAMTHVTQNSYAMSLDGGVVTGAPLTHIGERSVVPAESVHHSHHGTNLALEGVFGSDQGSVRNVQMVNAGSQRNMMQSTYQTKGAMPVVNEQLEMKVQEDYEVVYDENINPANDEVVLPGSYDSMGGHSTLSGNNQDALPQTMGDYETVGSYSKGGGAFGSYGSYNNSWR
eukprot:1033458_1